jgi:uncharacterized protein (TIGR03083 family)
MMPSTVNREELLARLDETRAKLLDLLPRFDDEQWRTSTRADGWTVHDIAVHVADSNYGLALMILGEIPTVFKLDEKTGWMNVDDLNEQRREKNAGLPREKVMSRLASALGHARRALESVDDFDAPSPLGSSVTNGRWLKRIVDHNQEHIADFEQLQLSKS